MRLDVVGVDIAFGNRPPTDSDAGPKDAVGSPRDQRMPVGETATLCQTPIRTRARHPTQLIQLVARQEHTVRHVSDSLRVVRAATAVDVEEPARHIGIVDMPRILVLEFVQAAASAAVAERLPLRIAHLLERLRFPERQSCSAVSWCRCFCHLLVV